MRGQDASLALFYSQNPYSVTGQLDPSIEAQLKTAYSDGRIKSYFTYPIPNCDPPHLLSSMDNLAAGEFSAADRKGLAFIGCPAEIVAYAIGQSPLDDSLIVILPNSRSWQLVNPSPGKTLVLALPFLDESKFSNSWKQQSGSQQQSFVVGRCGQLSSELSPNPFSTCIESAKNGDDWMISLERTAIAALLDGVQHGSPTKQSITTDFGELNLNWTTGIVKLPGQVVVDMDHQDFKFKFSGEDQFRNFLKDICPDCSSTGPICAKDCPTECGQKQCTQQGEKKCCSGDGMLAPAYSTWQQ